MSGIVLSKGIRNNLLQLQNTASNIATTQGRLATGKKVNSALDNPANFFTSNSLNDRAGDLGDLLDGISNAIQTINAANNGITSITNLVKSAQSTAKQAIQSSPTTGRLTGSGTSAAVLNSATSLTTNLGFTAGDTITIGDGTNTLTLTVGAAGSYAGVTGGGTTTQTATVGSVQDILDAVNATTNGVANLQSTAALTSDGKLQIESVGLNAVSLQTNNTATNASVAALGFVGANGATALSGTGTTNATRNTLAAQFDTILTQIDQLAKDSGYNGKNLLSGDSIKVVFNEKTGALQNSLSISGVDDSSTGLGINKSSNKFQTDKNINDSLTELTNALAGLRTQSSSLGSNLSVVQARQDFTKQTINTLKTGADNLVLADQNEEAANLLALQTRQQLSQTALSLANQADQGVLRLFG
ncbi:flagellin [Methyloraptor flagellatus]|uniref:Flagellin n=1 Tax=Methyloraptor flagellatus TaxID=3162530 RepID=A0AAU7XCA6_9HYPH